MVTLVIVGVLFLAGAATGCFAILVIGIHREEKARTLTHTQRPGRVVNGTRAFNGVYTRGFGPSQPPRAQIRRGAPVVAGRNTKAA
jgi:hypothetical protein